MAAALLEHGVDVLVEKPITTTLDEGRRLVALAAAHGRILQVGHLERFNPAIRSLAGILTEPRFIECHRLAPFTERGTDVDVILDLMIHDLDVILSVIRAPLERVEAVGVPVLSETADIANARLRFASGAIANVTASRVAMKRERKIRFFQADTYVAVDYGDRSIRIARRVPGVDGALPTIDASEQHFSDADPLFDEIEAFVHAVRTRTTPLVDGRHRGAGDGGRGAHPRRAGERMSAPLRVLLVAGEASGDLHGAALVRALRQRVPDVEVAGVGGPRLRAAGMRVLVDTEHVATMGFVETFGTLGRLLRTYRRLLRFLDAERPRLVVLIDYPEFNLRLARQAKRRGIPVFYFIAPQVWAWRRGRVRTIAERVDKLGVVFPFEAELYNNGRPLAEFIGHPLLDVVRPTRPAAETRARYGLDRRPAGRRSAAWQPREGGALSLPPDVRGGRAAGGGRLATDRRAGRVAHALPTSAQPLGGPMPFPIAHGDTYNAVAAADAAIVASGTATLETALLGCPMVIVYRMSPLTHWIARRLVDVKWIGMPNIILQRSVFPELIQSEVTPGGDGRCRARRARPARRDGRGAGAAAGAPGRARRRRARRGSRLGVGALMDWGDVVRCPLSVVRWDEPATDNGQRTTDNE